MVDNLKRATNTNVRVDSINAFFIFHSMQGMSQDYNAHFNKIVYHELT